LPTHGSGSFCSAGSSTTHRTTTVGAELDGNPVLTRSDEEAFVSQQLTELREYPAYYAHLAPINRAGPVVLSKLPITRALSPAEAAPRVQAGAWLVDGRKRWDFADAHVPGSLNVEMDSSFGTYVGWLTPFKAPLVLLLPDRTHGTLEEAVTQLIRIGYDRIEGFLEGGLEAWQESGRPTRSYPTATVDDLCRAQLERRPIQVLDVRQQAEWVTGHVPGSLHIHVGELAARMSEVPRNTEVWAACASGYRAAMAASLLDRAGVPIRVVADGGVPDCIARCYTYHS
jgi:rhodanese-related sulfurtransferase